MSQGDEVAFIDDNDVNLPSPGGRPAAGGDAALPGPYRIETPCGKRVLGFISPAHADRWLEAEGIAPRSLDLVPTAGLWCIPDTTPEQLAAEALLPLFRELHAIFVRLGDMETLFRARRTMHGLCADEGGGP